MKIRVADYIAEFLAENNIDTLFTVVGGGAMDLVIMKILNVSIIIMNKHVQ